MIISAVLVTVKRMVRKTLNFLQQHKNTETVRLFSTAPSLHRGKE